MEIVKDILGLIVLIGSAIAVVWKVVKSANQVVTTVKEIKKDDEKQREQNHLLTHGVVAALDGLQQLGANGEVTKAHQALKNYMIEQLR